MRNLVVSRSPILSLIHADMMHILTNHAVVAAQSTQFASISPPHTTHQVPQTYANTTLDQRDLLPEC